MNKPIGKSPSRKLLSIARTGAALVPVLGVMACGSANPAGGSVVVPLDGGTWSDAASDASPGNLDAGTDGPFGPDAGLSVRPLDGGDAEIDAPVVGLAPPPVDGGDASSDSGEDAAAATDGSVG